MSLENRTTTLFGPKTSKGRLYGGFYLLTGGIVLGLAALILFFIADAQGGAGEFSWREGALVAGAVALPMIFLGVSVALPTKTAMRIASVVGLAFCLLAAVLFVVHYPASFNTSNPDDYTSLDTGVYAFGLAAMLAATFTSIIGYYLDRLRPEGAGEGEEDDEFGGSGYEVPDWVVERDIEYAMKKFGVEWASGAEDRSLKVDIAGTLGDYGKMKVGGLGKARTVQLDAAQVDTGVSTLSQVRPGGKKQIPGEWADDSVAALVAFRKAKTSNPDAFEPMRTGFWSRMWGRVKGFFTGRTRATPASAPAAAPVRTFKANPPPGPTNGGSTRKAAVAPNPPPRRGKTVVIEDDEADAKARAAAKTKAKKGK